MFYHKATLLILLISIELVQTIEFDCLAYNELFHNINSFYEYERCNSLYQGCVQLTVLPTISTPQKRFFGCLEYANMSLESEIICKKNMWVPRQNVIINGEEYSGQFLCCVDVDMCNEQYTVSIEGIYKKRLTNHDDNKEVFFYFVMFVLLVHPFIFMALFIYRIIQKSDWEKTEIGCPIVLLKDCDASLYQIQKKCIIEDGKIPTLQEAREIYELMRKRRFRIRTTYNPSLRNKPFQISVSQQIYKASDHLVEQMRTTNTRFESLLFEILVFGPTTLHVNPQIMTNIFSELYELVSAEPTLIELPSSEEYVIIGDLRGEYRDLHRWFRINGYPPTKKIIVLGGMIMSENLFSLETLYFLAVLKLTMPNSVYLLRGSPESLDFKLGLTKTWEISKAITTIALSICEKLPLAATIGSRIYCVHGGLSPLAPTLKSISEIDRQKEHFDLSEVMCHMMFSEPNSSVEMYGRMENGRGLYFGSEAIKEFCNLNDIGLIIRAHNPIKEGFYLGSNRQLLSIWSTPGFKNCDSSSTVLVHANMSVEIVRMSC